MDCKPFTKFYLRPYFFISIALFFPMQSFLASSFFINFLQHVRQGYWGGKCVRTCFDTVLTVDNLNGQGLPAEVVQSQVNLVFPLTSVLV